MSSMWRCHRLRFLAFISQSKPLEAPRCYVLSPTIQNKIYCNLINCTKKSNRTTIVRKSSPFYFLHTPLNANRISYEIRSNRFAQNDINFILFPCQWKRRWIKYVKWTIGHGTDGIALDASTQYIMIYSKSES